MRIYRLTPFYDQSEMGLKYLQKTRIFQAGPKRCHYCGKVLTMKTATLDHRVAKVNGGTDDDVNLVMACERCNTKKDRKTEQQFHAETAAWKAKRKEARRA